MNTAPDEPIHFICPDCKLSCRLSAKQRAVQHALPHCRTWVAHKGNMQEFLRLALMAAKGNMIVGNAQMERTDPKELERAKEDIIEQVHEGLKRL